MGAGMAKIVPGLALVCMLFNGPVRAAQAMSEPEAFERAQKFVDQVVRIIPQRADGAVASTGFGLIVGERGGKVYVATPSHVVFGLDRPSSLNSTPAVVFRDDPYNTIPAIRLNVASPQDDLAVLEVAPPTGLILPHVPIALGAQLPRATFVWNIGVGQSWDMPDRAGGLGPQDVVTGLRRVSSLHTPPGASGGAVVAASGVIGIILQDARDYSWLLPVERIVQLFQAWDLPVNLLLSPLQGSGSEPSESGMDRESTRIAKRAIDQGNAVGEANMGTAFLDRVEKEARIDRAHFELSAAKSPFKTTDTLDIRFATKERLAVYCWVLDSDVTAVVFLPVQGMEAESRLVPGEHHYPAGFGLNEIRLDQPRANLIDCFGVHTMLPPELNARWMAAAPSKEIDYNPEPLASPDVLDLLRKIRAVPGVVEGTTRLIVRADSQ
jgi:hypothetical protein